MNQQHLTLTARPRWGARQLLCLLAFWTLAGGLPAQDLTFPLNNGFSATVYGVGPTICQPSVAASAGNFGYLFAQINPAFINNPSLGINLYSNNEAGYHIAQAGVTKQVILDIPNAGGLGSNTSMQYNFGQFDGPPTQAQFSTGQVLPPQGGDPYGTIRHVIDVTFPLGIRKGYLAFKVIDGGLGSPWPPHMCVIPFVVEGATVPQVDSLGTTVQPQMPYLVLHAPPGDGSSSSFQESRTTCRQLVDTYTETNSNSANLAVKLGTKGSIGFIATVDFEFSVTFNGGVTAEDMVVTTQGTQTCVTVNEGFSTTELTGPNGGGDVFIGYGTDLAYGVYPYLIADANVCASRLDTGLIFTPVGLPRKFAYTKTAILADIETLQAVVADSVAVGAKTANNAQNQIDVWNQVLAMNDANVNNPNNELIGTINFSAGVNTTQESSITITESNSIQYDHYLEGRAGVQTVVEIGGSGVSGGYEFKAGRRYGATQNQTEASSKLVKYTLADDDTGDIFNLDVVRDPMFGTPAFRIKPGTKSSCPYQGGYQRDQPRLRLDGTTDTLIVSDLTPLGSSFTFLVDLCNASNEARTYNLKLNAASNLGGAVISAAGVPLNGNDLGQSFSVPANSCIENLTISVSMLNANSARYYPDLELFLFTPCEEGIQSSIFATVYFDNPTGIDPMGIVEPVAVFPNPAAATVTVALDLPVAAALGVEIYDLAGRRHLHQGATLRPAGPQRWELPVHQLAEGVYTLRILSDQGTYAPQKLVVRR